MPDQNPMPALMSTITDIVVARDAAIQLMQETLGDVSTAYEKANAALDRVEHVSNRAHLGMRPPPYVVKGKPHDRKARFEINAKAKLATFIADTDASIWTYLLGRSGVRDIMDVEAIKEWEASMTGDIPEVTVDNLLATFQTVMANSDNIFKRGLANAFSSLDRRFKSHDAFKIGARIILTNVFSEFSGDWRYDDKRRDTIKDIERIFAKLDGKEPDGNGLIQQISMSRGTGFGSRQSDLETEYFKIRGFHNGNAHIWFTRNDLVKKANQLLADYYGAVVPDAAEDTVSPEDFTSGALVPAKDLQFYATPDETAEIVVNRIFPDGVPQRDDFFVLEPSAGTGNLVRPLLALGAHVTALEIHPSRARQLEHLEGPRCDVRTGNFLTYPCFGAYNAVVMNPPFYGTHWMEHVKKGFDHLVSGGTLIAILPVTAEVGESKKHVAFRRWAEKVSRDSWNMFRDLPPESFAASGTKINTITLTLKKR